MKPPRLISRVFSALVALAASLGVGSVVTEAEAQAAGLLGLDHPNAKAVMAVQKNATPSLMALPGVLGTAIGLDNSGQAALVIYIDQNATGVPGLPARIGNTSVRVELTDKFVAMAGRPGGGGGTSHTAIQNTPIQLGTSGGWRTDLANGYCCGGTLGSLIQVNGVQYILSNYHVLEADIVPGGNGIVATTGDPVIQPGLIDVNCNASGAQNVATLVKLSSLPGYNVDCAVARVVPGQVSTSILEIGTISSSTVAAALNQAVKKSGRTTGLSSSQISGLNATVSVTYENECAGGTAFTKTFTGQIVIANKGSKFLNSGDSGSLMVENVATKPRAVGLLYAGSNSAAIANPINDVLQFVGSQLGGTATMVGN